MVWDTTLSGIKRPYVLGESESCSVTSDSLQPHGLYRPWNSPGQNTGVGRLSLLQGIFPTQVSHIASRFFTSWAPRKAQELLEWVAYTLSSRSSLPRNPTGISCIVGGFFTKWTMREALMCLIFFFIWWFVCSCFDTTLF